MPLLVLSGFVLLASVCYLVYPGRHTIKESSQQYFSHQTVGGGTEFFFPEVGGIKSEWSLNGNQYMPVGHDPIEVPAGGRLFFKAGELFADQPELFRRFRPDDIFGLSFKKG